MRKLLDWRATMVGPCEPVEADERLHGRTSVLKLKAAAGHCYLKEHRERSPWDSEVLGFVREEHDALAAINEPPWLR